MFQLRPTAAVLIVAGAALAAAPTVFQDMPMPEPTAEHALLQKSVGQWKGTMTLSMPGMPETPNRATESVRAAGPFWIMSEFECEFMGMPYQGFGAHGFDPESGEYTSTWHDNMSSYLAVMKGKHDAESGLLVMHWDAPDMTGEVVPHRSEQKLSDDAYTMTFYTNDVKTMVIDMKRTSAKPVEAGSGR